MNRLQKMAWFNLKVLLIATPISLIIFAASAFDKNMYLALTGVLTLGLAGIIIGFAKIFVRKEDDKIDFDERDVLVVKKAVYIAYCSLLFIFIALCTIPVFVLGSKNSIPTFALPIILIVVLTIVKFIELGAILILYSRANKGVENE